MTKRTTRIAVLGVVVAVLSGGHALAQDEGAPAGDPFATTSTAAAPPPTPLQEPTMTVASDEPMDGPRFRFGVAGGGGGEFVEGLSAWLVGVDFRLGVQINDMIAVYAQPHMSFGSFGGRGSGLAGSTGVFSVAAMVDLTFADRFFAAAGFGYGVVNNPSGPMIALRGGFYPATGRAPDAPRRKGLSVSFEFRTTFIGLGPVVQVMGMVGYEAF